MLNIAIIGMGKMGRIRKQTIDAHSGCKVCAICDFNEAVAQEFPEIPFDKDWQAILDRRPDAVMVCTYNNAIPEVVCAALERGIHTFSEKPPGRCVEDVRRMMQAEENAKNRVLKFGFNHRFHYGVMEAKAIVDSGRYGRLLWARGIYGKAGGMTFENSWRSDKDLAGGGILLDQGIHMVDLLRYFMGDFAEVQSYVQNCYWKGTPLEDNVFALLKTNYGRVAMLHSSATHWKHKFSLDLFMEDGYICINGILSSTRSYGDESITFARKQFEDQATAMGKPREEIIYFDRDDSWKFELDEFYQCIQGKNSVSVGTSLDALRVMELLEMIYEAGKD